jgi:hypothetical protein
MCASLPPIVPNPPVAITVDLSQPNDAAGVWFGDRVTVHPLFDGLKVRNH